MRNKIPLEWKCYNCGIIERRLSKSGLNKAVVQHKRNCNPLFKRGEMNG